jgi:hypothetical protein
MKKLLDKNRRHSSEFIFQERKLGSEERRMEAVCGSMREVVQTLKDKT